MASKKGYNAHMSILRANKGNSTHQDNSPYCVIKENDRRGKKHYPPEKFIACSLSHEVHQLLNRQQFIIFTIVNRCKVALVERRMNVCV